MREIDNGYGMMCVKKIGFKSLVLALLGMVTFSYSAVAIDLGKPLPQLSAEELHWEYSSGFHSDFAKGLAGDCDPLVGRLEKAILNEENEYTARIIYGEMYDRAICVPYDPTKAFKNFKRAADMGGPYYYAITAWKHAVGHGVEKSNQLAHENFKLYLLRTAVHAKENILKNLKTRLIDRDVPDQLLRGVNWLSKKLSQKNGSVDLAKSLIVGNGTYFDGTPLPQDKLAALYILERVKSLESNYVLGHAYADGVFGESRKSRGSIYLGNAASCGSKEATFELIEYYSNGDKGFPQLDFFAYAWFLFAKEKKYEGVEKFNHFFEPPSHTMETQSPNRLKTIMEQASECPN